MSDFDGQSAIIAALTQDECEKKLIKRKRLSIAHKIEILDFMRDNPGVTQKKMAKENQISEAAMTLIKQNDRDSLKEFFKFKKFFENPKEKKRKK